MGLSNFPSASEGVLPVLVINTVLSVGVLKSMFRSMMQVVGGSENGGSRRNSEQECRESSGERRVSITEYKALWKKTMVECCVCLCRFEGNEEVSELPCKHYFHRGCLEKWFDNKHVTCPLCRSMD
ncbi:hypothetical protein PHAVU_001G255200 [Phaseolus vulgaris]|uniref:RING-type domain-containing protein n=1 Tax=Phaseolus vulgaris TaxID=3885 RepID=V7D380_PHAVU|nr:hypothetical protein PHAVU_001G255200g [Phaseolus vulgaris]ESW35676.1 hypothetical protein PHAVU_001G255200g [Phaseolus vulgaris]